MVWGRYCAILNEGVTMLTSGAVVAVTIRSKYYNNKPAPARPHVATLSGKLGISELGNSRAYGAFSDQPGGRRPERKLHADSARGAPIADSGAGRMALGNRLLGRWVERSRFPGAEAVVTARWEARRKPARWEERRGGK